MTLTDKSWVDQSPDPVTCIQVCKVMTQEISHQRQPLFISHCLSVDEELQWSLFVHNQRINLDDFSVLSDIPKMLTQDSLSKLLQVLNELKVCPGNPDDKFVEIVRAKKGGMKRKDGELACFVDDYASVHLNGDVYETTIRPSNYGMLVNAIASRCENCNSYRNYLRTLSSRQLKKSSQTPVIELSSHVNDRFLSTPEKQVKMSKLKKVKKKLDAMTKKLDMLLKKQGEEVDKGLHADLLTIMKEKNSEIDKSFPSDSFRKIFWEQQFKASKFKRPASNAMAPNNHKMVFEFENDIQCRLSCDQISRIHYTSIRTYATRLYTLF